MVDAGSHDGGAGGTGDRPVDWRGARRVLLRDLLGNEGFVLVFLLTLLSLFLLQAGTDLPAGELSAFVATFAALGLALHRTGIRGRWRALAVAAGLGAVLVSGLSQVVDDPSTSDVIAAAGSALFSLFMLITLPAVLGAAFGHRKVTLNTVAAALTTFLLLGILFTTVLRSVDLSTDEPLFTGVEDPSVAEVTYFSFVTLTTLGYGDLTPETDLGRAIATLEAITGQVFLVTAVALTVSRLGQDRRPVSALEQRPATDGPPDDGRGER